jgi:hypothetical protein
VHEISKIIISTVRKCLGNCILIFDEFNTVNVKHISREEQTNQTKNKQTKTKQKQKKTKEQILI